jgi:RNA polymerase sigma-70 factor (ECF subfamily)
MLMAKPVEVPAMNEPLSLLQRVAAGDQAAVKECLDSYGGLIWTLARRLSPSAAEAEDAVQEIFIELWKTAARFDPAKASEKTFVVMVTRRRLIDRLRKRKTESVVEALPEDRDVPSDDHRQIEYSADASLAARALKELRPEQRRLLELSIFYGMTHQEIADATETPLGTVKSHIRRGLAIVREKLTSQRELADGGVTP